jgi:hypothetical protein
MRKWKHKIKIRDISEDSDYQEEKELEEIPKYGKKMKERLISYPFIPVNLADSFLNVKTLAQFNRKLDLLYDFCDANDIWVNL